MQNIKIGVRVTTTLLAITILMIGILTYRDYGESLDESPLRSYSDFSLRAYHDLMMGNLAPDLGKGNYRYYGPAFLMTANLFVRLWNAVTGNAAGADTWHLASFLSFDVSTISLYLLARRWFSTPAALITSLLFLFQPLLWGQAFINPKDVPFMAFFLISVLVGLQMRDRLFPTVTPWSFSKWAEIKQVWMNSKSTDRSIAVWLLVCMIALPIALFISRFWFVGFISSWVTVLLQPSNIGNGLGKLFSFFVQGDTLLYAESYVRKALNLVATILEIVVILFTLRHLRRMFENLLFHSKLGVFPRFAKNLLGYLGNPAILFSGILLGLTASIRILGPFAGLIVGILIFNRAKQDALPALLAYIVIAALAIYLTWPYLWPDPVGRFRTSLMIMSNFPWDGKVLFNGNYYTSDQLPWNYVPLLFGIQFTEPVVLLFIFGLGLFSFQLWKRQADFDFSAIVLLWGALPFAAFAILRPSLYDNIRQILFIVPPLFLLAGLAVQKLWQKLGRWYLQLPVTALFLLAGIYPIIHLHPYQYVYYNSFAGGLQGAYRRFESDYLATSSREAIEYINRVAPENAHVIIYTAGNTVDMVVRYARPDLIIDPRNKPRFDADTEYDYAVISTRGDRDTKQFTEWPTVFTVERDSNIFILVKQGR
ncbi:MAG: hypothetical protein HYR70_05455 [Chloroflexi bacterium]|nr:hypothetical protein [Chloroflexota bacterium]MBI3338630.1 hypothetical protein [Chloroflexota bacterium]